MLSWLSLVNELFVCTDRMNIHLLKQKKKQKRTSLPRLTREQTIYCYYVLKTVDLTHIHKLLIRVDVVLSAFEQVRAHLPVTPVVCHYRFDYGFFALLEKETK